MSEPVPTTRPIPAEGSPPPPATAGRYELGEEIARGGMGVILRARDETLNRDLAVKVLLSPPERRPDLARRFLEEAQIAGQLQHPGVVPIHEIGTLPDGRPFFAMKLVKGETLAELLKGRESRRVEPGGSPHDLPRFLTVFEQVCQTLAYAHSKRVIHRDLKPANVMVGAFGEVQVMDWGLAKVLPEVPTPAEALDPERTRDGASVVETARAGEPDSATQAGSVLGTFAYMPPEQARGEVGRLDRRCDVFGLGAILCEVLTGEPPYTGTAEARRAFAQVGHTAPAFERLDRCGADGELVALAKWCLAAEPEGRPADAGEVAAALTAYLGGVQERLRAAEITQARTEERAAAEQRRRRLARALAGVVLLALLALLGGGLWHAARLQDALKAEGEARGLAEENEGKTRAALGLAERNLYHASIALADREWQANNVDRSRTALDAIPEPLRNWEWHYLRRRCDWELLAIKGSPGLFKDAVFSPDGKRIAIACEDRTVSLRDATTGAEVLSLGPHPTPVGRVAFSPDGRRLAAACKLPRHSPTRPPVPCVIKIWDVATGAGLLTLRGHTEPIRCVAYSRDGAGLASGGYDDTVRVWDAATGKELLTLPHPSPPPAGLHAVAGVAFNPDGKQLASADDHGVRVWDLATGRVDRTMSTDPGWDVVFSPDGKRLVCPGRDGTVIWEVATGREALTLRGTGAVALNPDGTRLATAGENLVKLWDAMTGREVLTFRGPGVFDGRLSFHPDGRRIISTDYDGCVRVWDAGMDQEGLTLPLQGICESLVFSPDGRLLCGSGGYDGVAVFDVAVGCELTTLRPYTGAVGCMAFSPDGQRVAWSVGPAVKVGDAAMRQELITLSDHGADVISLSFAQDGRRLASVGRDDKVLVWDLASGRRLFTISGRAEKVAFSPDGSRLASGDLEGTVRLLDATTGQELRTLQGHSAHISCVAFSPDGKHLASGSFDRTIKVWDAAAGVELITLAGHSDPVSCLAFSPDGTRLVSGGERSVRIWDTTLWRELLPLAGDASPVRAVAFSPDGQRIAAAGQGTVRVWEAVPLTPERRAEREAGRVVHTYQEKVPSRDDLLDHIRRDPALDEGLRERALALAARWGDDPVRLHLAAWEVVRRPDGPRKTIGVPSAGRKQPAA
jgi:WD40 repeat protein